MCIIQRRPVVLKRVPIGPCVRAWTASFLAEKGGDREVKVHVSPEPRMDFLHKNFVYRCAIEHEYFNTNITQNKRAFVLQDTAI